MPIQPLTVLLVNIQRKKVTNKELTGKKAKLSFSKSQSLGE